jgi:hypothetical protein
MGANTITLIQFIVLGGVRCMVNNGIELIHLIGIVAPRERTIKTSVVKFDGLVKSRHSRETCPRPDRGTGIQRILTT